MTISPQELINLFQSKNPEPAWSFEGCKPSETSKWTHGYHRYPAKFIPQLVEKLIEEYVVGNAVQLNDPFMGSGTTVATAISRGMAVSGTDVNAMAYLITKVKTTPIEPTYLDKKIKGLLATISPVDNPMFGNNGNHVVIPQKHITRLDYWFSEDTKNELGKILGVIYQEEDSKIRDFFLVAFSHILKSCAMWLQGSTKPVRDLKKKPTQPRLALQRHLKAMQRGNERFYGVVPPNVRENLPPYLNIQLGDARQQPVANESVDLVVTSSPYVTSYEYADLHQLSTIWLDLAEDLAEYRQKFIGTAHKNYADRILTGQIANHIVAEMADKSKKMAQEIAAYFIDMQDVFNESYRILKRGGRCCYVIGNTKLKGVEILNAQAFAEGLSQAGFELDRVIVREIPSKILPQKRDEKTGRFASNEDADSLAYPIEYIVIGLKE